MLGKEEDYKGVVTKAVTGVLHSIKTNAQKSIRHRIPGGVSGS